MRRRKKKKQDEEGKSGTKKMGEEAKTGRERDSQSMKQFDNLVILLLKSISSQRPAI